MKEPGRPGDVATGRPESLLNHFPLHILKRNSPRGDLDANVSQRGNFDSRSFFLPHGCRRLSVETEGQVFLFQDVARAEEGGSLREVSYLPDVSGPTIAADPPVHCGRDLQSGSGVAGGKEGQVGSVPL